MVLDEVVQLADCHTGELLEPLGGLAHCLSTSDFHLLQEKFVVFQPLPDHTPGNAGLFGGFCDSLGRRQLVENALLLGVEPRSCGRYVFHNCAGFAMLRPGEHSGPEHGLIGRSS